MKSPEYIGKYFVTSITRSRSRSIPKSSEPETKRSRVGSKLSIVTTAGLTNKLASLFDIDKRGMKLGTSNSLKENAYRFTILPNFS